ncbi:arsenite methyltransferase-like [Rhinophrynus dorsalis]
MAAALTHRGKRERPGNENSSMFSSTVSSSSPLQTYEDVKDYYGKQLNNSRDLKTSSCAAPSKPLPKHLRDALNEIHEDISSRYFGCGISVPECLENCSILDLGSGSGRDCYMLSKLVGQNGHVTGIDMTIEQVEIARRYIDYHMQKFGLQQPNVEFIKGYIENLQASNIKDNSYDVIISNCVICLSPDKRAVLKEAYRVLKDGGEMYFSDMYINKELAAELKKNKVLWGEGMGGALTMKELFQIAEDTGFCTPRLVTSRYLTVNKELENIVGDYKFVSGTFRLFKLPQDTVKERCQVVYKGGITGCENELQFDANFTFKRGDSVEVDEELCGILKRSRFADMFSFHPLEKGTCSRRCHSNKRFRFSDRLTSPLSRMCPLLGNRDFPPGLSLAGFTWWRTAGVTRVPDLLFVNTPFTWDQFREKFSAPPGEFYHFVQAQHFVTTHFRNTPVVPRTLFEHLWSDTNQRRGAISKLYAHVIATAFPHSPAYRTLWETDLNEVLEEEEWASILPNSYSLTPCTLVKENTYKVLSRW